MISNGDVCYVRADLLDYTSALVTQYQRSRHRPLAKQDVVVGVAYPDCNRNGTWTSPFSRLLQLNRCKDERLFGGFENRCQDQSQSPPPLLIALG